MVWRCSTCKTIVKGRFKSCQTLNGTGGCGKPKRGEPFFDDPGEGTVGLEDAVTDQALIPKAEGGSDWQCRFCSSHQFRVDGSCAQCGANQGESRDTETKWNDGKRGPAGSGLTEREEAAKTIESGLTLTDTEPSVHEKLVDAEVQRRRQKRAASGTYRKHKTPAPAVEAVDSYDPLPKRRYLDPNVTLGAGAVVLCAILGVLGYILFRTRIVDAQVTSVTWAHIVHIERFKMLNDSGFAENRPSDATDVTAQGSRHHHYKQVQTGTKRERCGETCVPGPKSCRTTPVTCVPNDNGFKTCSGGDEVCTRTQDCSPDYCDVPVFIDVSVEETWYTWTVWRWRDERTVVEEGRDNNPRWPSIAKINLNANGTKERETTSVAYNVVFTDTDQEKHNYTPRNEDEFRALVPGAKRRVKVSLIGASEIMP